MLAHLGMNLADDYGDAQKHVAEIRETMPEEGYIIRIPKSPYLLNGTTSKQLAGAICVFLGLACLCGLPILIIRGWKIAAIVALGAFLGLMYSCRPLRLGYHGLGEFVIGIMFGPLEMMGVFFATCGLITTELILVSCAVGLLVINIVYTHAVLDVDGDEHIQKLTLARAAKTPKKKMFWMYVFNIVPFVIVIVGVALRLLHPAYLLLIAILPLAIFHIGSVRKFIYNIPCDTAHPSKWLGNMANWQAILDYKVDWYMYRWLVARNIVSDFCLFHLIITVALIIIRIFVK
ncbi:MAG: prenyltransferase [Bacteroidales bacterium]|nr:prenyltransferase [Bacteroidales bacterium]